MPDDFDPATVAWVFDTEKLRALLGAIEMCTEVEIDLETTGGNEHATRDSAWGVPASIVMASLTLPQEGDDEEHPPTTWVVPLSHPESPWLGKWRQVMLAIAQTIWINEKPVINQNMKFDARWIFAHTGIDLSHLIAWDTQSGSHLLDETVTTRLKERASRVFGIDNWKDNDLTKPGAALRVPLFDLGIYAAHDTYYAWRLAEYQRRALYLHPDTRQLEPEGAEDIEAARLGKLATWCAMPMVANLTAIEQRGLRLDVDWTQRELGEHQQAVSLLKGDLAGRYAGLDPAGASFAPTSNWFKSWAQAAVDAGDLLVTAFTQTGVPQWSKGVLIRQARAGRQVAQDLLDVRGHIKKAEYLTSWLSHVTPRGFIHTSYYSARVITGRLSSSDPNIQQVTAVLKPAFIPSRPSRVLIDLDYSQIELRVAAFISRCAAMIEAFQQGWDLHTMLAAKITGKPESEITPMERQAGKSANFGLLYMMGAYGFQQYAETVYGISFTAEESQIIHQAFYEMWTGIGPWHDRSIARARSTGQVISPLGRVRRLPDIHDGNDFLSSRAERAAVNAPVQGMASDVMQIAAASIGGYLPGVEGVEGAFIVGTVHDSILIEAEGDDWERVAKECVDRMLNVNDVLKKMGCVLDVPLAVEGKVGTRWGLADIGKVS
jgi:DNA polymerase I